MNGYKLGKHVKENYGIPVIMTSGTAEHDLAKLNGIDILLQKPISPNDLIWAVERLLQH